MSEYPGAPRWVKVSGIIALVLVLLVLALIVARGSDGGHAPGRHFSFATEMEMQEISVTRAK